MMNVNTPTSIYSSSSSSGCDCLCQCHLSPSSSFNANTPNNSNQQQTNASFLNQPYYGQVHVQQQENIGTNVMEQINEHYLYNQQQQQQLFQPIQQWSNLSTTTPSASTTPSKSNFNFMSPSMTTTTIDPIPPRVGSSNQFNNFLHTVSTAPINNALFNNHYGTATHNQSNESLSTSLYDPQQNAFKKEKDDFEEAIAMNHNLPPLPFTLKLPSLSSSPSNSFSDVPISASLPNLNQNNNNFVQAKLQKVCVYTQKQQQSGIGVKKEKPFSCSICLKRFTQKHSLTDHMRIHSGEKPFECDICHKRFRVKYNCKVHRRIHTGEKPYKCTVCAKAFTSKTGLNSHNKRMHPTHC